MRLPSDTQSSEPVPWTSEAEEPSTPRYARLWKAELWEAYRQVYAAPAAGESGSHPVEEAAKPHRARKLISLAVRVALTIAAFALLSRSISWETLASALAQLEPGLLVVGLLLGAGGVLFSTLQWRSLLHGERIWEGTGRLLKLYLVGMAFSHFLPTGMGGDAVKAIYVGRDAGNNEGSVSAVLMARVTGLFGMFLIAFPVLIIWRDGFAPDLIISFLALSALVGGGIVVALLMAALLPRLLRDRWTPRGIFAYPVRIANALIRTSKRPRAMAESVLFGVVFWGVACVNYWIYGAALQVQVPVYFYFVVAPLISLLTFLPISINGYGLRESALVVLFASYHVPAATTLVLALLMDAQVLVFGALGGLVYLTMGARVPARGAAIHPGMSGRRP